MTIYGPVLDTSAFLAANSDASSGDTIIIGNDAVVSMGRGTFKVGVDFVSEDVGPPETDPLGDGREYVHRFTRRATILLGTNSANIGGGSASDETKIRNLNLFFDNANYWPDPGQTWEDKYGPGWNDTVALLRINELAGTLTIDGCRARCGIFQSGDDLVMDGAYLGSVDDPESEIGQIDRAPVFIFGYVGKALNITRCHITDFGGRGAIAPQMRAGSQAFTDQNQIDRVWTDAHQISYVAGSKNNKISVNRTLVMDNVGVQYGKHGDVCQLGAQYDDKPINGVEMNNVFAVSRAVAGTTPQFAFLQSSYSGAPLKGSFYRGGKLRNLIGLGVNKMIDAMAARDTYARNCIGINPVYMTKEPGFAASFVQNKNAPGFIGFPSGVFLADTICEGVISDSPIVRRNVQSTAVKDAAAQAAMFAGGGAPETFAEAWDWVQRKGGYTSLGPQYASLHDFFHAPLDWEGEPVFARVSDVISVPPSTVCVSAASIHGGNDGDMLPVTVSAGLEWAVYDLDLVMNEAAHTITSGTVISGFSSVDGSVPVGKMLAIRATSSATPNENLNFTYSVGGESYDWALVTASDNDYPGAVKPLAVTFARTSETGRIKRGGVNVDDSKEGIVWLDFVMPDLPAVGSPNWFEGTSNRTFRCALVYTSGSTYSLILGLSNSAGSNVGQATFAGLIPGKRYQLGMSVNTGFGAATTDRVWAGGVNVTDNISVAPPTLAATADGLIAYSFAHGAGFPKFGANNAMTIYAIYCDAGRSFQGLGLTPASNWRYTADDVGPNGEGLTDIKPWLFIVGEASGISNRGDGAAWSASGGSLTPANGKTWPPPLGILAFASSARVGEPIEFTIRFTGYNRGLTLDAASTGAGSWEVDPLAVALGAGAPSFGRQVTMTFTPSAAGEMTFSFTNDVSYTNPDPLVLNIAAAPTLIPVTVSIPNMSTDDAPPFVTSVTIEAA